MLSEYPYPVSMEPKLKSLCTLLYSLFSYKTFTVEGNGVS
jgi:hypothetical protein